MSGVPPLDLLNPALVPPHPGSFWQECPDVNSGYPYYWNTLTNQVVWEIPPEMIQYRHSLLALPPPNPPPPPTSVLKDNIPPSSLVCGYDSEPEPEEDEVPAETIEADPEFIGPRVPRAESDPPPPGAEDLKQDEYKTSSETYTASQNNLENENSKEDQCTTNGDSAPVNGEGQPRQLDDSMEDIMSKIEAEQPPDYQMNGGNVHMDLSSSGVPPSPAGVLLHPPPPSHVFAPPPPPPGQPTAQQPTGLSSFSLLSSYSDSDQSDSDSEDIQEVKPSSKLKPVTGQLDSSGRIFFPSSESWQTAEQKAALDSYKSEHQVETAGQHQIQAVKEPTAVNSRKRRIALPGGRFNKSSEVETEKPQSSNPDLKSKYAVQFVKSSTVLPGSLGTEENKVEDKTEKRNGTLNPGSISPQEEEEEESIDGLTEEELAEELVEKLEFFKVGGEKISSLKLLAVKIETLYSAWSAGALTANYLKFFLETAHRRIRQTELDQLCLHPWTVRWDRRDQQYRFRNRLTGEITFINPHIHSELNPPPLPTDTGYAPPPPPSPPTPPPGSPPTQDNVPQDMDLDDEDNEDEGEDELHPLLQPLPQPQPQPQLQPQPQPELPQEDPTNMDSEATSNFTDELSSFYSEIGFSDPVETPSVPAPQQISSPSRGARSISQEEQETNVEEEGGGEYEGAQGDSAPSSPAPPEAKRRKRAVKVSNSLSMKKKGLNNMLAKWQNIN